MRDLATQLGLSIGTVSRALQDHPGLNNMTKQRVLRLAQSLGYKPNLAARYLVSKRGLRISLNTPQEIAYFYDAVRKGLDDEAAPFLATGIEVQHRVFPKLGDGEKEAFEAALDSGVDGVIVVPGDLDALKPSFRRAGRMGIPVVCVITDAPSAKKLASVSVNTASSGSLAAELLGRFLGGKGPVAMTTGDLRIADHLEKSNAYSKTARDLFPSIKVFPPIQNHEFPAEAYDSTRKFFRRHREVKGLYIGTGTGAPVLRALDDLGLLGEVTIIATDIFEDLLACMARQQVSATFYERPYSQGRLAFRKLYDFLIGGKVSTGRIQLEPLLMMRSNVDQFQEAIRRGQASEGSTSQALIDELIVFDRHQ